MCMESVVVFLLKLESATEFFCCCWFDSIFFGISSGAALLEGAHGLIYEDAGSNNVIYQGKKEVVVLYFNVVVWIG